VVHQVDPGTVIGRDRRQITHKYRGSVVAFLDK
jgi:hypothetical protein